MLFLGFCNSLFLRFLQCTTKRRNLCGLGTDLQVLVLAGSYKLVRVNIVFKCILTASVEGRLFAPEENSCRGRGRVGS